MANHDQNSTTMEHNEDVRETEIPPKQAEIESAGEQEQGEEQPMDTGQASPSTEELMLTLEDARAKADEYWNQLLRARADLENMQRRAQREIENAHKYGLEKLLAELLPVKDSLELGFEASGGEGADVEKVREGINLTVKMLSGVLEKFGIREISPQGEKFNPEFHQAMTMQEAKDVEPNTVLTVHQKGYLLNDRLIRPAMVVVSKPTPEGVKRGDAQESDRNIDEMA